jgi:glutathione S-transferase
MALQLYAHPFSSYCQKVEIALYECGIPFELKMLGPETPEHFEAFARIWPLKRMPLLLDDGRPVMESSVIIEHLALHHGAQALLPGDGATALDIRFMDRVFDNYVMTPMQRYVGDYLRPAETRDPQTLTDSRALLDTAYVWLEERMQGREWTAGSFSMADCAAAPALFYADWVHPIPEVCPATRASRARLLARPSVARAVDEARPYRPFLPPGAPDRD